MAFQYDEMTGICRFWWNIKTQTGNTISKREDVDRRSLEFSFETIIGRRPRHIGEACELYDQMKRQEFEAEARDLERKQAMQQAQAVRAAEISAGVARGEYKDFLDKITGQTYENATQASRRALDKLRDDYATAIDPVEAQKLKAKTDDFLEKMSKDPRFPAWVGQPIVSRIPPFVGRRPEPAWIDDITDDPEPPPKPQTAPSASEMADRFKNIEMDT